MSTRLALLVLAAFVLLVPADASASDWGFDTWKKSVTQSDWEGYAAGTSYTTRTTMKGTMGGQAFERVTDTKTTLVKVTEKEFTIKTETSAMGMKMPASTSTEARKKDVKVETKEAGSETITVAGTAYACKKIIGTKTEKGKKETMTFWVHETAGVLKYQMNMDVGSGQKTNVIGVAKKLKVQHKVGTTTFDCREFEVEMNMPQMGKTKRTMRLTKDSSPVQALWHTGTMSRPGMGEMVMTTEVVAITIKKP